MTVYRAVAGSREQHWTQADDAAATQEDNLPQQRKFAEPVRFSSRSQKAPTRLLLS